LGYPPTLASISSCLQISDTIASFASNQSQRTLAFSGLYRRVVWAFVVVLTQAAHHKSGKLHGQDFYLILKGHLYVN
jgi:hypothetical protein